MELWQLKQMQTLPLEVKIEKSLLRIKEWYEYWGGNVYVSFSGGKDSTVLLHLVRSVYPDAVAVFVDTGLEYPEIREFVKAVPNVIWLKPKLSFKEVIEKYGYPVSTKRMSGTIYKLRHHNLTERYKNYLLNGDERGTMGTVSKRWRCLIDAPFEVSDKCCDVMKKRPMHKFVKDTGLKAYVGNMAAEGSLRRQQYLQTGCNAFNTNHPISSPLGFWTDGDIWEYIRRFNVPYSKIYDTGVSRPGCVYCMFGVHLEPQPNRFQRMKVTHPQLYRYCMDKLGLREVLKYINVPYE